MDIRKFIDFYEDDNEQQFKDFLSEYKGKTLHLVDNYLDVLKQSEDENFLIKVEDTENFYDIQLDDDCCIFSYCLKFKKEFPCYANEYEETELCLYYNETGTEAIPLWSIEEAWNYMKQKTVIDEVKETVISGVEESKYKSLILKMMSNLEVIEKVNQLKQSATNLTDEDVIKILVVIYSGLLLIKLIIEIIQKLLL